MTVSVFDFMSPAEQCDVVKKRFTVDAGHAFNEAQACNDCIHIPHGGYLLDTQVEIQSGRKFIFDAPLIKHSNDTDIIFSAHEADDWSLLGEVNFQGNLTTQANTGEGAILIHGGSRWYVERLTAKTFKGTAVTVTGDTDRGTYRGDTGSIGSLDVYENYLGFDFKGSSGSEYFTVGTVKAAGNITAGQICAGNVQINGGNIVDNGAGLRVHSAGAIGYGNHAHGSVTNVTFAHNADFNIFVLNVLHGQVFNGCKVYGDGPTLGRIKIQGSRGVLLNGGILDAKVEMLSNAGYSLISNNWIPGSQAAISGSVLVRGNFAPLGPWEMNNW